MQSVARLCARLGATVALAALFAFAAPAALGAGSVRFHQGNLVSDGGVPALHTDPNLVNAWGIAFNPFAFAWIANADSGTSTLYDGDGNPQSLVVAIPGPAGSNEPGAPTGIVFNGSNGFVVSNGTVSGPSRFLFATENGVIAGWAPNVDATHAIRMVDNSASRANYKGLALSADGMRQLLYAADFFHARVEVYDAQFQHVTLPSGAFTDPNLPKGYAPSASRPSAATSTSLTPSRIRA